MNHLKQIQGSLTGDTDLIAALPHRAMGYVIACQIVRANRIEYVTWRWNDGACFWGHYFDTMEAAMADFHQRAA